MSDSFLQILYVIYEQRERVFHRDIQTRENIASQMNRDVTGCFGLLT